MGQLIHPTWCSSICCTATVAFAQGEAHRSSYLNIEGVNATATISLWLPNLIGARYPLVELDIAGHSPDGPFHCVARLDAGLARNVGRVLASVGRVASLGE